MDYRQPDGAGTSKVENEYTDIELKSDGDVVDLEQYVSAEGNAEADFEIDIMELLGQADPKAEKSRARGLKAMKRKAGRSKRLKTTSKIWAIVYMLILLGFEVSLVIMDILPARQLMVIIGLLSAISLILMLLILPKKRRDWVKRTAMVICTMLMLVYATGINYVYGTLDFLSFVSRGAEENAAVKIDEPFNVYVTGIDQWGDIDKEGRSDVNMVVTVNPVTHTVLLTSIPRDYEIYMPDHDDAKDKLTHTGIYGVQTSIGAVEDLLDIEIDHYIRVNFSTVIEFVDALGGIDVMSVEEFTSDYGGDHVEYEFKKGMNHLNGRQALAFARERKSFALGDRTRVENQQRVVKACIKKATSSTAILTKYGTILKKMKNHMQMDITSGQIRSLIKMQLDEEAQWTVKTVSITGADGRSATYSGGYAYIMVQDEESINKAKDAIDKVYNPTEEEIEAAEAENAENATSGEDKTLLERVEEGTGE